MAGFMESVATINSALRTLLAFVLVSVLGVGGWYGYTQYNATDLSLREKDREIEERNQRITALEGDLANAKKRAEKLEIAVRLLGFGHLTQRRHGDRGVAVHDGRRVLVFGKQPRLVRDGLRRA